MLRGIGNTWYEDIRNKNIDNMVEVLDPDV